MQLGDVAGATAIAMFFQPGWTSLNIPSEGGQGLHGRSMNSMEDHNELMILTNQSMNLW